MPGLGPQSLGLKGSGLPSVGFRVVALQRCRGLTFTVWGLESRKVEDIPSNPMPRHKPKERWLSQDGNQPNVYVYVYIYTARLQINKYINRYNMLIL